MSIKIENLQVNFGKRSVIEHLDLAVDAGEIVGLVAPNGTGKTTLLRTISTLIISKLGKIQLNKYELSSDRVGYLKQFFSWKVVRIFILI